MNTNKQKRVLIALDYDPTARKVAESGFSLALSMNADVILMHVISDPVYYSTREYSPILGFTGYMEMGQLPSVTVDQLKVVSQLYLDNTKQHLGDKNIQTIVREGDLAESILDTAKEINADIIVMGSHSHRWLEEVLMGSATEKVLDKTVIPLFLVPTKMKKK
jgi:nucleotide-binding universal stress UspA family protein